MYGSGVSVFQSQSCTSGSRLYLHLHKLLRLTELAPCFSTIPH